MQAPTLAIQVFHPALAVGTECHFVFYWGVHDLEVTRLKRPIVSSIASDAHFWVPVIVLILGTALLAVLR